MSERVLSTLDTKGWVYFISFSYVNNDGLLRNHRMQTTLCSEIKNVVMLGDIENQIYIDLFLPRDVMGTIYAPILNGDPHSVVITNFILLKTL
jgi:hypothetical protein